ncbi:hypothetical protein LTR96_011802, partial [Exophiala xenobiotica]
NVFNCSADEGTLEWRPIREDCSVLGCLVRGNAAAEDRGRVRFVDFGSGGSIKTL